MKTCANCEQAIEGDGVAPEFVTANGFAAVTIFLHPACAVYVGGKLIEAGLAEALPREASTAAEPDPATLALRVESTDGAASEPILLPTPRKPRPKKLVPTN